MARTWRLHVPASYDPDQASPLIVSTHGWGGDGQQEERSNGLTTTAARTSAIVVFPDGASDNSNRGSWGSWNVVGSTRSPGPEGPICYQGDNSYCYDSCRAQNSCDSAGCSWTTCANDVNGNGFGKENPNGFLPSLYDLMEAEFCIDTAREYHAGFSNGGMATFQMGASLSHRLAAIVPNAGAFHVGYVYSPARCLPVLDIHGTRDTVVPANTTRGGGWYYTTVDTNMRAFAQSCPQCSSSATRHFPTSFDGRNNLHCRAYDCDQVVRCAWDGSHTWPSFHGELAWEFMNQFSNEAHVGFGHLKGELNVTRPTSGLTEVQTLPAGVSIDTSDWRDFEGIKKSSADKNSGKKTHYGNPKNGCMDDEEVLEIEGGRVCAPKIGINHNTKQADCRFADVHPNPENGCPEDTPDNTHGKWGAFPTCTDFASDETTRRAHCTLTCGPCRQDSEGDCMAEADDWCPVGATCQVGAHKHTGLGTCVYHD